MSNAFADMQTVYKTNYDYSSVNSNIHFIRDVNKATDSKAKATPCKAKAEAEAEASVPWHKLVIMHNFLPLHALAM